ncbi:hypothetical protein LAN87_003504 [Salmonella enterica]|nr:hypothetical protein [Salmonella enterica]HCM1832587.1 hypothetical protein [Salmonella enterica subsp. salamae serovar 48:z81:z39]EHX3574066.1 hypothetical protein [Salmonella enterica]EIB6275107.1 hypothetical protein [Salmonella enterica]EIC8062671.1 hypothetical protein [Salmonella enterica]
MVLVLLVIFPGVIPFVPLVLPAPQYGCRWIYICIAIIIQLIFCFFDLTWGNLDVLLFMVIGISLLYYSVIIKSNKILASVGAIFCICFLFLLGQQLYLYNRFFVNDICFNFERYCGASCYKDYSEVSCKTKQWKTDVFHGSPGSYYLFDIDNSNVYVIFGDANENAKYLLIDGGMKKQ